MKDTAASIVKRLKEKGFTAYYAGGAVRDMLLGIDHGDIDIATSATPDEIEQLFVKTYPIGKEFGVIHVHEEGHQFEVATFRNDSGYSDGRRPDFVTFSNAQEDAKRRDFTINGMFYDPLTKKVIDHVGGEADLKEGVIRFIGDPEERIKEDHLRLLRAVRFAHQIKGQFEPATYEAIKKHAHLIKDVSQERVRDELNKMLLQDTRANAMEDLQDLGLLTHIFPELEKLKGVAQPKRYHREGSCWNHAMQSISSLKKERGDNIKLIWAVLLHDIGKPATFSVEERIRFDGHAQASAEIARKVLRRLRFSNRDVEEICWAVEHHMSLFHLIEDKTSEVRKRTWFLNPAFEILLELHRADIEGTTPSDLTSYKKLKRQYKKIIKKLKRIPKLLSGHEVAELTGLQPGKELGDIMKALSEQQLLEKITTQKQAISFVKKMAK